MTNAVTTTGICLYGLPAREEAVVKRVISFSGTQGRDYTLSPMDSAGILVVSDETAVDFAAMNPAGCMIIRIADSVTTQAYDVLMQRPLLVTKVMRTLDEAGTLLKAAQQDVSVPAAEPASTSVEPTATNSAEVDEKTQAQPKPQMQPQAEAAPVAPVDESAPSAMHTETLTGSTEEPEPTAQVGEQLVEATQLSKALTPEASETGVPRQPKPATSLYAQIMGKTEVPATGVAAVTPVIGAAEQEQALQSPVEEASVSHASTQDEVRQGGIEEAGVNHTRISGQEEAAPDAHQSDNNEPTVHAASSTHQNGRNEAAVDAAASTEANLATPLPETTSIDPAAQTAQTEQQAPELPAVDAAEVTSVEVDQTDYHHLALVVDDSLAIRKQLELELRDAGIGAHFAETGEEALEKIADNNYDLVFLDIIMPGIDGYEACRQMRMRSDMKKTPIIMLSAKTSPLDEVQGVIAGASTYLTKPVKSEQLQKTLKRVSMWLDNFQVTV